MLISSFLKNYLSNLVHISTIEDPKQVQTNSFRETSSILTIISILLNKHQHLIPYVVFLKKDYIPIVQDYLPEKLTKKLKSVTFLECIFMTGYFEDAFHDLFILFKTILTPKTGITFLSPSDPDTVQDVSYAIVNTLFQLIEEELEVFTNKDRTEGSVFSKMEEYLTIYATVNSLNYIWALITQTYQASIVEKFFRKTFLKVVQKVLKYMKNIPEYQYKILSNFDRLTYLLGDLFNQYYENQMLNTSQTQIAIDQLKIENYKSFIKASDLVEENKESEEINDICEDIYLKKCPSEGASSDYSIKEEVCYIDLGKKESLGSQDKRANKTLKMPLTNNSVVCGNETWAETVSKTIEKIQIIESCYANSVEENYQKDRVNLMRNLGIYLDHVRFDIESETQYTFKLTNLLPIALSNLNQKMSEIKTSLQNIELGALIIQRFQETQRSMGLTDIKSILVANEEGLMNIKEDKIRFFVHPTLNNRTEFDLIRCQVLLKLKLSTEKIQTALLNLHLTQEPIDYKKQIISNELTENFRVISKFETNLLFCLLDQFEILQPIDHPPYLPEIKKELQWIESNFIEYITILKKLRKSDSQEIEAKSSEPIDIGLVEPLFPTNFRFCNDHPSLLYQTGATETTKALLEKNGSIFRELYTIDDEVVESMISFFYLNYDKSLSESSPNTLQILQELCNSANFEVKLMDFCLFFLYCPEHLELLDTKLNNKFPYSVILNAKEGEDSTPNHVYNGVAANILDFLKIHFSRQDYLIYQPKVIMEQYGLQSLHKLKLKANYNLKASHMVSICDLIVGLRDIPQINSKNTLLTEADQLIFKVFSKEREFEIVEVQEGRELIDRIKLFSSSICHKLLKVHKVETILKYIPDLVLYDLKVIARMIENAIEILHTPLEKVTLTLKMKIESHVSRLHLHNVDPIAELQAVFKVLGDVISSLSYIMTKRLSDPKQNIEIYSNAMALLSGRILHEKAIEDFFICLFEILEYLSYKDIVNETIKLSSVIVKICLNLYALICINENYTKSKHTQSKALPKDGEFPTLSHVVSIESVEEYNHHAPELSYTFSSLRKSRQFDFGILVGNMCKKHQKIIHKMFSENINEYETRRGISIVWKRLPWILDLNSKKKILMDRIDKDLDDIGVSTDSRSISIDRTDIIKSTLAEFSHKDLSTIRSRTQVCFKGEYGADAGGLTREWLTLINKELFDPKKGLFEVSGNKTNLQPSPASKIIPYHLKYLELAGITLAKAIQEDSVVDVNLTKPFLKHILKRKLTLNDLEDIDSDLTKSLRWMLENDVEVLEQPFTYEARHLEQKITRELVTNGYNVIVTNANKKDFVDRVCQMKMRDEINEEIEAFLRGFYLVLPVELLDMFSVFELQLLISGAPVIDVGEIKAYAKYIGYEADSEVIGWIWEIFAEFTQKELAAFVFFISGSVKIPMGNFEEHPIRFRRAGYGTEKLPIAHTCFWEIEVPPYESKAELKQKLLLAIFEGQGSFMLN